LNLIKSSFNIKGRPENKRVLSLLRDLGVVTKSEPLSLRSKQELEYLLYDAGIAYRDKIKALHSDINTNSDGDELRKLNVAWNKVNKILTTMINPIRTNYRKKHYDFDDCPFSRDQIINAVSQSSTLINVLRVLGLANRHSPYHEKGLSIWLKKHEIELKKP
jgi:hypothetical protein